jgi:hypothetical protein
MILYASYVCLLYSWFVENHPIDLATMNPSFERWFYHTYAEFSYNNSYQESLKMTPFEMLYGRSCRTLLFWSESGERKFFGPDILQEVEKHVRMVRENLRIAQSRQKSYADHRRRELSFEVGDFVYLKVSPMRSLCHFIVVMCKNVWCFNWMTDMQEDSSNLRRSNWWHPETTSFLRWMQK